MRTVVIFIALVVVVAAGLVLAGVFDADSTDAPPPAEGANGNGATATDGAGGLDPSPVGPGVPQKRPALTALTLPKGSKVLVIGAVPNTADQFMMKVLGGVVGTAYHGWYLNPSTATPLNMNNGLPPLTSVPTALTLSEHDHDVVVISNVNALDLSDDFWDALASRVKAGQTHVLWRAWPPYPGGDADTPAVEHPWLTHPVIAGMLPVKDIIPLRGVTDDSGNTTVPGQLGSKGQPFLLTSAGETHMASRLVAWPEWSRVWWDELGTGKGSLRTQFCVPVTELVEGATTLLAIDNKSANDFPVLVAGSVGDGRVLWLGTRELSWEAYYDRTKEARLGVVIQNMLAWLAGAK